jgi:putative flavoprotein involved in K+ transport
LNEQLINSAEAKARQWLGQLDAALAARDIATAVNLFADQCFWRDFVAFTWNIKTMEGRDEIADMLKATLARVEPRNWRLETASTLIDGQTEGWFTFETAVARGRGILRLKGDKCRVLLTTMNELTGHEEKTGATRAKGVEHGAIKNRKSWLQQKTAHDEALGGTVQPYCVIIGGGQGGIALGARLKRLGVPTIILEKNKRAGDSWRNRYKSLVLHDPVWYDHLPYLPFPDHWPVFTPKDQMGDWLEMYARVMELNYWGSSECRHARFDEAAKEWVLTVDRDGKEVTLRGTQLIFATGAYGPPNIPSIAGGERFLGAQYHSSQHVSGEGFEASAASSSAPTVRRMTSPSTSGRPEPR